MSELLQASSRLINLAWVQRHQVACCSSPALCPEQEAARMQLPLCPFSKNRETSQQGQTECKSVLRQNAPEALMLSDQAKL